MVVFIKLGRLYAFKDVLVIDENFDILSVILQKLDESSRSGLKKGTKKLASLCIPDLDGLVLTATGKCLSVGIP